MSISSSLQQMAGGVAAILSGSIVIEGVPGAFRPRWLRVGTTLLTLSMMYLINRRIGAGTYASEPALAGIAVEEGA
jgi:hypothetical protein